jgi:hypothetical protein
MKSTYELIMAQKRAEQAWFRFHKACIRQITFAVFLAVCAGVMAGVAYQLSVYEHAAQVKERV